MNDAPDDAFRSVASGFQKSFGYKMDTLSPHEAAVHELRAKGASYTLIARMLGNISVHVSAQTLRRFCIRSATTRNPDSQTATAQAQTTPHKTPSDNSKANALPAPFNPLKPSSSRGPRIADPSTQ
jgi:hypothetical protein